MRYLLLCCANEQQWNGMTESERGKVMREYGELVRSLEQSGHHVAGAQLQPVSTATTVRGGKNGKPVVTDGPFAETKEQLGGYHLLECRDFEEAVAIAKRIPTLPHGGAIEIRALM